MNTTAPRIFLPVLREIEEQLSLPIPERVRILSELEWDLEALWKGLVAQGVAADEARNRALRALVPDPDTLRELGHLHAPLYRRATEGVRDDRLRLLERSALAITTGCVLLAQTYGLLQADLLRNPSNFLWVVLGLGALLMGTILATVFQLWIKGDHRRLHRGVQPILLLSAVILLFGAGGTLLDLFQLAGILEARPEQAAALIPVWVVRECTLLAVSTLLAMAGCFFWFVLTQWLTLVRGAHRHVLGLDGQGIF